jgi:flavorubredoxin
MVTYIPEKELLLSNDAFGQHVASTQKFEDELGWDIAKEEAAKYYANIVLPYGQQVNKALDVLSTLKIDMIAPSHGIIWRSNIKELLALYRKWANNATTRRSVVVYDSMWGSTAAMAGAIVEAFDLKGIPAKPMDLKTVHISDVMAEVLEAEFICVGSPTLNNGMLPTVAGFLSYMKGLAPKNRRGLAFGSYGWGGQSLGLIEEQLKSCGMNTFESVKHQYVPDTAALAVMTERVKEMLDD